MSDLDIRWQQRLANYSKALEGLDSDTSCCGVSRLEPELDASAMDSVQQRHCNCH